MNNFKMQTRGVTSRRTINEMTILIWQCRVRSTVNKYIILVHYLLLQLQHAHILQNLHIVVMCVQIFLVYTGDFYYTLQL